jgi:hypothetical protein
MRGGHHAQVDEATGVAAAEVDGFAELGLRGAVAEPCRDATPRSLRGQTGRERGQPADQGLHSSQHSRHLGIGQPEQSTLTQSRHQRLNLSQHVFHTETIAHPYDNFQ